jgi:hypothetical protein
VQEYVGVWKNVGFMNGWRKLRRTGDKKTCFSARSFTLNPTQSDASFNCCYTFTGQNLTT